MEFLGQTHVGSEGCITSLFLKAWQPVIELVEAVAEADTLSIGQVGQIVLRGTLCEALVVQVL